MASRELISPHQFIVELYKHGLFSAPLDEPFSTTHTSNLETSIIYEDNASCVDRLQLELGQYGYQATL